MLFGSRDLIATRSLLAHDEDVDAHAPSMRWRAMPSRLLLLGITCLVCLWPRVVRLTGARSSIHDDLAGTAALGAIAYAVFSIGMGSGG